MKKIKLLRVIITVTTPLYNFELMHYLENSVYLYYPLLAVLLSFPEIIYIYIYIYTFFFVIYVTISFELLV